MKMGFKFKKKGMVITQRLNTHLYIGYVQSNSLRNIQSETKVHQTTLVILYRLFHMF